MCIRLSIHSVCMQSKSVCESVCEGVCESVCESVCPCVVRMAHHTRRHVYVDVVHVYVDAH